MKIAQYKLNGGYVFPMEANKWREEDSSYIRVSEVVEVEFKPLAPEVLVPKELAVLDNMEKALTAKHLAALGQINTRRQELRALAAPPQPHHVMDSIDSPQEKHDE